MSTREYMCGNIESERSKISLDVQFYSRVSDSLDDRFGYSQWHYYDNYCVIRCECLRSE